MYWVCTKKQILHNFMKISKLVKIGFMKAEDFNILQNSVKSWMLKEKS